MIKVLDNSKDGIYNSNMELVDSFTDYSSKNLDFDKPVTIELMDDEENAKNPLGTTAHYNPDEMKITIYVTGRHIKDILRSISHELIHHVQHCRGDLSGMQDTSLGYAQRDKHMRDMETEAFNSGNIMNFRDFEDNYKQGNRKMSKLQENRLKKLNGLLMEQSRGEQLKNIANALNSNLEGFVDANDLALVIQGLKLINSANEYKLVDAHFKKNYGQRLRTALSGVSALTPTTRRRLRDAIELIASIERSVTLDEPSIVPDGSRGIPRLVRDPVTGEMVPAASSARAAPKGQGQRLVRDPVTGEMVPLAPDAQIAPRATSKAAPRATSKGPRKYRKCTGILRMGCGGDNIEVLQRKLHNVLKLKSNVDSFADKKFGPATKRAVKAFQRAAKLKVDGEAGPNTLKALDAAVAGKLGIATPKGPAGDIDRLAKPGSEISDIFDQKALENNITRGLDRQNDRYREIKTKVMSMIRNELGSDKRKEYLTGNKISRLKTADKIKRFITQVVQQMGVTR